MDMKAKTYNILQDAIENGIDCGYRRAHKHTDDPSEAILKAEIDRAIWDSIHEVFTFEQEYED